MYLHINGNTSKPYIMIFDENDIFSGIYFLKCDKGLY